LGKHGIEADEVDVFELESHCALCPLQQICKPSRVAEQQAALPAGSSLGYRLNLIFSPVRTGSLPSAIAEGTERPFA
jgi:hypothetical protein